MFHASIGVQPPKCWCARVTLADAFGNSLGESIASELAPQRQRPVQQERPMTIAELKEPGQIDVPSIPFLPANVAVTDNRVLLNLDKASYSADAFYGRDVTKSGDSTNSIFKANYGRWPTAREAIQYANYNLLTSAHDVSIDREIISPPLSVLQQEGVSRDQAVNYLMRNAQYQAASAAKREEAILNQSADYARSEDVRLLAKQQSAEEQNSRWSFREASMAVRAQERALEAARASRPTSFIGPDQGFIASVSAIVGSDLPFGQKVSYLIGNSKFYAGSSETFKGSLQAAGGALEYYGGATLDATGLGAVIGVPVQVHGLDNWVTGLNRIRTESPQPTITYAGIEALTGSPRVAGFVDTAIPFVGGAAGAAQGVNILANRALTNATIATGNTTRSLSNYGGIFSTTINEAGGEIITSTGTISQNDFATYVNAALYKGNGNVNIISGVHGDIDGTILVDSGLYKADLRRFGDIPGVQIHNFPDLSPTSLKSLLSSPDTTIGGFCNSGVCLAPYK